MIGPRPALDAWGGICGRVERRLHAKLASGHKWRDLATTYYEDVGAEGLSAKRLEHVARALLGKCDSARKVAVENVATLKAKVAAKDQDIRAKEKRHAKAKGFVAKTVARRDAAIQTVIDQARRLATTRKNSARNKVVARIVKAKATIVDLDQRLAVLRAERDQVAFAVHQGKRRLGILTDKLTKAEDRADQASICFGSRALFRKQFHLEENGYADHAAWLADWRAARSANILVEGAAAYEGGNQFVRATVAEDGSVSLEIRLPESLAHLAERHVRAGSRDHHTVTVHGLRFNHGHHVVVAAIRAHDGDGGRPISWRFVRIAGIWYVHVMVHQETPEAVRDFSRGCLGLDLNEHHVAVTQVSADGNPLRTWRFPLCTHGLSSEQALDLIRKTAKRIVELADTLKVPLVSERLDFAAKKARLETDAGPRWARMLSAFAYSSFDAAIHSACRRLGVWHERVNPAFTSMIGRLKFARLYGLSVHAAAALSIGRRAMGQSERLPSPVEVLLGDGARVTLLPLAKMGKGEVSRRRHVWASWGRLSGGLRAVLAAHARSLRADAARGRLRRLPAMSDGFQAVAHGKVGVLPEVGPGLDRRSSPFAVAA